MKLLFFVLSLGFSSMALSAQQITGKVERIQYSAYLQTSAPQSCHKYRIEANSEEAAGNIEKLSTGDALTASGVYDNRACRVLIDSVDYVGLKDLLGLWYNDDGYVHVHNFTTISVHSIQFRKIKAGEKVNTVDFRYSVTPSSGNEWVVFLSTPKSTTFATVNLKKTSATVKIFDSENGSIVQTINLKKMVK